MIRTFKHKGLEKFYYENDMPQVLPSQIGAMWRLLSALNVCRTLDALVISPFQELCHPGDDPNEWAFVLNSKWCISFKFNEETHDVTDIDYYQFRK